MNHLWDDDKSEERQRVRRGDDIGTRRVVMYVCELCFGGDGGECHVPGCAFWMNDAPDPAVAEVLRYFAEKDRAPVEGEEKP